MGTWTIRKLESSTVQALCVTCKERPQKKKTNGRFMAQCGKCHKKRFGTGGPRKPGYQKYGRVLEYSKHKKSYCEECGFIAVEMCQLDVDHIDGNKFNNDIANLQTLCANCHRLKTHMHNNYMSRYK